jgi:hypothetical protein
MPKFIVITGSVKKTVQLPAGGTKKLHHVGDELELSADEAAALNKRGPVVEPLEVHKARAKAKSDAKAAVEAAEKEAAEKLKPKGGGK